MQTPLINRLLSAKSIHLKRQDWYELKWECPGNNSRHGMSTDTEVYFQLFPVYFHILDTATIKRGLSWDPSIYSELLKEREKDEQISFQDVLKMSSAYQKVVRTDLEKLPRSFWLNALFFPQGPHFENQNISFYSAVLRFFNFTWCREYFTGSWSRNRLFSYYVLGVVSCWTCAIYLAYQSISLLCILSL